MRIPTPKKIPPSLKEYSVGQLSKDYLPIITTTTTTTTTYTHLILATLSFYFWPMPKKICRMPNFMRPGLHTSSYKISEVGKRISLTVPEIDISFNLKWLQSEPADAR